VFPAQIRKEQDQYHAQLRYYVETGPVWRVNHHNVWAILPTLPPWLLGEGWGVQTIFLWGCSKKLKWREALSHTRNKLMQCLDSSAILLNRSAPRSEKGRSAS